MLIVALLRLLTLSTSQSTAPAPAPAPVLAPDVPTSFPTIAASVPVLAPVRSNLLTDEEKELDLALLSFADGFDWKTVRAQNPPLANALADRWARARAAGERLTPFVANTRKYLLDRFRAAIAHARYDDIRAWRELERTEIAAAGQRSGTACDDYIHGRFDPTPFVARSLRRDRRALMARVILADRDVDRSAPRAGTMFTISGDVLRTLKEESGLTASELNAALGDKGTPDMRCKARIGLLDTALALPPAQGVKLLREM